MRRTSDQVSLGVSVATLVALFGVLYTIYRNSYMDVVKEVERFEARMGEVVKTQNAAIEELRRRKR